MDFQILIADKVIELHTIYTSTYELCKDYLCEDLEADVSIKISKEDILEEKRYLRESVVSDIDRISEAYLETLAVYRKIASRLLEEGILLMHGSVVASDHGAVMFTAPSGTGKTTRSLMWIKYVPNSYILNGDKPLLKITEDSVVAYGTPWAGKENMHVNAKAPLSAIVLLERAEENSIERISLSEAMKEVVEQIYRPDDSVGLIQVLKLVKEFNGKIDLFRLRSNLKKDAILLTYKSVFGKDL